MDGISRLLRSKQKQKTTIPKIRMKYGIITHYDVHNHGAVLQLNALIKVLKKNFCVDAKALRFDKNYDFMGRAMKAKYDISLKSVGIYISYLREKGLRCFVFNYKKKLTLDRFKRIENLIGNYYTECCDLDGIIIGSDEVFALHTGPTPVFFGHALPSEKVFAYGGCFGPTTINDVEKYHCRALISSGLKSMCGLGMRDLNSVQIGEALTGIKPELVCDPVILYGYREELMGMTRPKKDKYMVIYSYDNYLNESYEVEAIKKFARKNGWKVVSPGFYHKWADLNVNVDPIELLNWFQHAECVVTNTFHGCVMSIITGREMAVKLRKGTSSHDNANKLNNLMQEYKIIDRQIDDNMQLNEVFSHKVNWEATNQQIKERRASSMDYLKRMIEQ